MVERTLIERLNVPWPKQEVEEVMLPAWVIELCAEGAAHIAALEAQLSALEAENERLRKALEPFALVAEHDISEDETDNDTYRPMPKPFNHAPQITVGHLRTARDALDMAVSEGKQPVADPMHYAISSNRNDAESDIV